MATIVFKAEFKKNIFKKRPERMRKAIPQKPFPFYMGCFIIPKNKNHSLNLISCQKPT
jgi:hypothetical protein